MTACASDDIEPIKINLFLKCRNMAMSRTIAMLVEQTTDQSHTNESEEIKQETML